MCMLKKAGRRPAAPFGLKVISIVANGVTVSIDLLVGISAGCLEGFSGNRVMRFTDPMLAFPRSCWRSCSRHIVKQPYGTPAPPSRPRVERPLKHLEKERHDHVRRLQSYHSPGPA